MKLGVVLLIPALALTYYFCFSLPAHNRAVLEFEKQKYADQQRREQEDAQKRLEETESKRTNLSTCVYLAEQEYLADIKDNGARNGHGGYTVNAVVANSLQRKKEHALSECHR